jgi:hypothetical protein
VAPCLPDGPRSSPEPLGQQQLLLLVLGVVIVGLAVVVGVQAFGESRERSRLDQRMAGLTDVATRVQAWSQTPSVMGGGTTGAGVDWTRFRLAAVGLDGEQTTAVTWRWGTPDDPLGCSLLFVNPSATDDGAGTHVHLHLLNEACDPQSYRQYPTLALSGAGVEDIEWDYPSP